MLHKHWYPNLERYSILHSYLSNLSKRKKKDLFLLTRSREQLWKLRYIQIVLVTKAGSYNIIVSDTGTNQTIDYKGFIDNELWIVIDDSNVMGGTYLTFYTENPDNNPNAPIAVPIA